MKAKEFASLAHQLLPSLPGFVVKGPLVFLTPVRHFLRGIYFERSVDKKLFYVSYFFMLTCIPTTFIGFNLGKRIRRAEGQSWSAEDPDLIAKLGVALKQQALPFLSRLNSFRDVVEVAKSFQSSYAQQTRAYALARNGDVGNAVRALDDLLGMLDRTVPSERARAERAEALRADLREDASRAQLRLDAWEAETLKNLRLEQFK